MCSATKLSAEQIERRREFAALYAVAVEVEVVGTPGERVDDTALFAATNVRLKRRGLPPFDTVSEFRRAVEWWLDNLMVDARIAWEEGYQAPRGHPPAI
jgi:hypothetical protein